MTEYGERKKERYKNDEEYRNNILRKAKEKYHTNKEYRENKIEQAKEYAKTYIPSTPQKNNKKKYLGTYYTEHRDKIMHNTRVRSINNRFQVLYWYSNGLMKCNECGEDHVEFLCMDHIDDSGADHRREIGAGGDRINMFILRNNFPGGYQVLCNNCNYLKEHIRVQIKPKSKTTYAIARTKQRRNTRLKVLYWYSNGSMQCECCGIDDIRLLTIDHINGGGKQHVIDHNIADLYEHLYYAKYPEGYRILCWNCNKSYGQYGYCPHQIK